MHFSLTRVILKYLKKYTNFIIFKEYKKIKLKANLLRL